METTTPYQTPGTSSPGVAQKLSIGQTLFSFKGRIPRSTYWIYLLISMVVVGAVIGAVTAAVVVPAIQSANQNAATQSVITTEEVAEPDAAEPVDSAAPAVVVSSSATAQMPSINPVVWIVLGVFYIFLIWIGLALQVKRWHDRDKPGVWVLINFIPFIGGIWALVECGFLPGTPGPNRFGNPAI